MEVYVEEELVMHDLNVKGFADCIVVDDDKKIVGINDFENKDYIKLSVGKKTHLKVTIT